MKQGPNPYLTRMSAWTIPYTCKQCVRRREDAGFLGAQKHPKWCDWSITTAFWSFTQSEISVKYMIHDTTHNMKQIYAYIKISVCFKCFPLFSLLNNFLAFLKENCDFVLLSEHYHMPIVVQRLELFVYSQHINSSA